MSILIRGMDMPKNCWECPCEIAYPSYGCSACGAGELHAAGMIVPYCWKCGAKMDGGVNDAAD